MATLVCPPGEAWPLDDLVYAADTDLAEDGALVSANDQPAPLPVPAGFFFSLPERARRMRELLSAPSVTAANMRDLQLDLLQPRSLALRGRVAGPASPPRRPSAKRPGTHWRRGMGATAATPPAPWCSR